MDKLKQYVAGAAVLSLAIMALGYNFLVAPKKSAAAELREQAASQDSSNAVLRTKLATLKAQAKDLPKEQAKLAAVAAKIPDNPALPSLIRALTAAGISAGVELVSLTPGTPTAATAVAPAAAAVPAAPAAGAPAAPAVPAAAATAGSLNTIPVTLNVVGSYFQVQSFLGNLESLSRAFRVSAVALAPGSNPVSTVKAATPDDGRVLSSTITAEVFMASGLTAATDTPAPVAPATK